ncbi:hypothetical protein JCM8097_008784 [Rhodosporidiobolus ruineniae]
MLPLQTNTLQNGVQLAYIDSFSALEPEQRPKEYTTLIGLHGVGFNSAVWTPLLPHLPPSIRFLAYNQRSYASSSPAFNAKELGGVDATAQYLGDLMEFLRFAVEELGVKAKDEGGVVLMGWSKGTVLPLSLLSVLHTPASSTPSSTSYASHPPLSSSALLPHAHLLPSHLRSLLLFEPPGSSLGRAPTADYTTAMAAVSPPHSATADEFAEAFAGWIGGYCPPSPSSPSEKPVEDLPPSGLAALSPEVLSAAWEPQCVAHGFSWRLSSSPAEAQGIARQALAPQEQELAYPVGLIYGKRTNGYCLDAAATIEGWWAASEGGMKRTATWVLPETNHFAFVHEPEAFARAVVELIEELQ